MVWVELSGSKRDEWFENSEGMGFDILTEKNIPEEFNSDAWYRNS
ncbi:hypothetical protein GCM10027180_14440 [Microbulbifer echini]